MTEARSTRLDRNLRLAVYVVTATLLCSGALWLAAGFLPQGTATVSMRVHGAAAMLMLFVTGWAVALHMPAGWREGKNRASGAILAASLLVLAITGYGLYYLGDETTRGVFSIGHWLLGFAALPALAMHAWL